MDFPFLNNQRFSIGDIVKHKDTIAEVVAIGWHDKDCPIYYLLFDEDTATGGKDHLSRQMLKLPRDYRFNTVSIGNEPLEEVFKV